MFAGVGKKPRKSLRPAKADILMFNVESPAELQAINEVAASLGVKARVALRINPDIDPKTHPYISTGLKKSKFGIAADRAIEEFKAATAFQPHQGGGAACAHRIATDPGDAFVESLKKVLAMVQALANRNSVAIHQHRWWTGDYLFRRNTP